MVEVKGFEPPLTSLDRLADSGHHCQSCGQKLPISGQQVETTNEPDDATGTFDVASRALVGHSGSTIEAQQKQEKALEMLQVPEELKRILHVWPSVSESVRQAIQLILFSVHRHEKGNP